MSSPSIPSSPATLTESKQRSGKRVTLVGMAVNVFLIALKITGGIFGSSAAMIADAFHSLSDFITDIGVLIGLNFLAKPPDSSHPYGHARIETGISLLMGLTLFITGLGILKSGGQTVLLFFDGVYPEKPGIIALATGIVSILSKERMFRYTRRIAQITGSRSLEANAWHHLTDAFSSVGTVIGISGALVLGDRWTILDPVAAIFVSFLIIRVGITIGWNAFRELSDESLSAETRQSVENAIKSVTGVSDFHHVRTRSLGRYVTIDAHVLVDPELSVREGHEIATNAENAIRAVLRNAAFVTIHVEPEDKKTSPQSPNSSLNPFSYQ